MGGIKRVLFFAGVGAWFFLATGLLLFLFFPYERALRVAFQNIVNGSSMTVSFLDARVGFMSAKASKVVVGHTVFGGKPILELERVSLGCNPVPLFRGVLSVSSDANAYGGKVRFDITDIPVIANPIPNMRITFADIDLSRYPEGRFDWFKGMSGTINGSITKQVALFVQEQQKGVFDFKIRNGEVKELHVRDLPKFILPFKEIAVEGKTTGNRIDITKVLVSGPGVTAKGRGVIESGEAQQRIDVVLTYEGDSKASPLSGRGTINIVGNLWFPEIIVKQEAQKAAGRKR
jgi:type II secretion system protein N